MMSPLQEFLRAEREPAPRWLEDVSFMTAAECASAFLSSRIAFYPGSGYDGGPVEVLNPTHAVHCYIYVDYGEPISRLHEELERGFKGYSGVARIALDLSHLTPRGWVPHIRQRRNPFQLDPFGFIEILSRSSEYTSAHGAERIAILFLGADAFATFDALFCQLQPNTPYVLALQDHGFGGNYDRFGGGGILEWLAGQFSRWPAYLLIGPYTVPWTSYSKVDGASHTASHQHGPRTWELHKRSHLAS